MRNVIAIAAALMLVGCAGQNLQTPAQQLQADWPKFTAAVGVIELDAGASPGDIARTQAAELSLKKQVDECAVSADPTCASQLQGSVAAFLSGVKLGPKGKAYLALAEAFLPWTPAP
jgi:hypothetical protein